MAARFQPTLRTALTELDGDEALSLLRAARDS